MCPTLSHRQAIGLQKITCLRQLCRFYPQLDLAPCQLAWHDQTAGTGAKLDFLPGKLAADFIPTRSVSEG